MRLDNIANILSRKCGLTKDHPVVVGVSGGADSLALMHAMFSLGYDLIIAHLDHALRPESSREADFVKSLAAARGLPFISARIDVKAEAEKTGNSLEEAARNVRYRFLFDCARKAQAQAVAVAHHADDQVETILMHFIRGAARSGLAGMPYRRLLLLWDSEIPLVRPLLDVWRTEINTYVSSAGLKPRIDLSNQDTTYFRNRLRHELIPEMETYNPEFRKVLLRTADVFRMEKTLLDDLAKEVWRKCLISKSNEQVILKITPFKQSHKALQRRVLRQAIAQLRPDLRDVGYDVIERALGFIEQPCESREIDLVSRLNLGIIKDMLIIKSWASPYPGFGKPLLNSINERGLLESGQEFELCCGWQIRADLITELPEKILEVIKEKGPHETWLDFDHLEMPLVVRGRKEGERWQPLGMGGRSQKISDFFINEKMLAHMRDLWPLVCSQDQVAWVAGMRPSELYKVTESTTRVLRLRLIRG